MALLNIVTATPVVNGCDWPQWQQFKAHYMTADGRIIDPRGGDYITTSEGQSYALFFALVANDQSSFKQILKWTEAELAAGDLSKNLPAWLWAPTTPVGKGRALAAVSGAVKDANSAADADLWIAYSLLEAGRLWRVKAYEQLGTELLEQIRQQEVVKLPGLGWMLLPGKVGFVHSLKTGVAKPTVAKSKKASPTAIRHYWRLNPSYTPPQLLARFQDKHTVWQAMAKTNKQLLIDGAPLGFAPDWVYWEAQKGFRFMPDNAPAKSVTVGSYDAIRVYLWVGMLADDHVIKQSLFKHYLPFIDLMQQPQLKGLPAEKVDVLTGALLSKNVGPLGFSAALLPFLQQNAQALQQQRQRLEDVALGADNYYTAVLRLFGEGFDNGHYRFKNSGKLLPAWSLKCQQSQ